MGSADPGNGFSNLFQAGMRIYRCLCSIGDRKIRDMGHNVFYVTIQNVAEDINGVGAYIRIVSQP